MIAASGTFAAIALIFDSPLVAAILLIEATGIGGPRLPMVLVPGLLAAGIGSLVSIGLGSLTGLSSRDYALGTLDLPTFARPDVGDFGWTIALAVACAVGVFLVLRLAREAEGIIERRPFILVPAAGVAIAGLAIAFSEAADKGVDQVLFSGQDALGPLVANPAAWSALRTGAGRRVQEHRLEHLARRLSRRAHVPGAVPGCDRRRDGLAFAGLLDHAGGGGGHGGSGRRRF